MDITNDILDGKHDDRLGSIAAAVRIRRSVISEETTYQGYGPVGNICVSIGLVVGSGAIFSALGAYISPLASNIAGVVGMILGAAVAYWECTKCTTVVKTK